MFSRDLEGTDKSDGSKGENHIDPNKNVGYQFECIIFNSKVQKIVLAIQVIRSPKFYEKQQRFGVFSSEFQTPVPKISRLINISVSYVYEYIFLAI